jgi:DNA-binding NtrC family response regulator
MRRNILIISHNQAMSYLLQTVIGNKHKLVITEDVFQGMHQLKHKQNINLIIIDIDHQTKESIDFIQHINSSKLYNKPVIVLSDVQNQKLNEAVIEATVYDYFIKPFSPIELKKSIDKLALSLSLS